MNEKIKEIAEFDGWTPHEWYENWFKKSGKVTLLFDLPYMTNFNVLHRVALDVMDKVTGVHYDLIKDALLSRPINGQYTDLVDAVYDAIVYLKNHNQCQPK